MKMNRKAVKKDQVKQMNKNKMAFWIGAVVILLFALLISIGSVKGARSINGANGVFAFSVGGKAKLRNTIELPTSEVDALTVEYGSKNIYVYPASEDKIVIKEYLFSDDPAAQATVTGTESGEVFVRGSQTNHFVLFGIFMGMGERIEVYIPETDLKELSIISGSGNIASDVEFANTEGILSVQAGSGNINWDKALAKDLSFQAGSGNIRLNEITGDIKIKTGSGNITCEGITGVTDVRAGSGNITIDEFCGSGSATAGSGNIKIVANNITDDIEIETGSGNNKLEIPESLSFRFEAKTGSGNINTDFDDALTFNQKGNQAEGSVGTDPAVNISMRANSGNVRTVID